MAEYAHPEVLVSTQWVAEHAGDTNVRIVESDEDVLLYTQGHVPGAVKIDWHTDLQDQIVRDYIDKDRFAELVPLQGNRQRHDRRLLRRQEQLVGLLRLLGLQALRPRRLPHHERRPQALGGRRPSLVARARAELSARPNTWRTSPICRFALSSAEVLKHQQTGKPLVDVRSPGEYTGELLHMPDYPQEGACAAATFPAPSNVPWSRAVNEDGTFKVGQGLGEAVLHGERPQAPVAGRSPIAASASGRATPGSCCTTCSAFRR